MTEKERFMRDLCWSYKSKHVGKFTCVKINVRMERRRLERDSGWSHREVRRTSDDQDEHAIVIGTVWGT